MKGNFWRKLFRKGYNAHGYRSAEYNGKSAKTDAKSTRTRLKGFLKRLDDSMEE